MKKPFTCSVVLLSLISIVAGAPVAAQAPAASPAAPALAPAEALRIAVEGYVYLYPLVTMEVTRKQLTNVEAGKVFGRGPMNAFSHMRSYPDAEMRAVVRPNFDTLYSSAWLDLSKEPLVVSSPDTKGRYFLLPMLDMWSDVFAVPGKRTSGTAPASWALAAPGWKGTLPAGVQRIDAPTSFVWIIGRTQTNGPKDYDAVHEVQNGYTITPLSRWGRPALPVPAPVDPSVDMTTPPLVQVNTMPAAKFFGLGAELMKANPPHATDWSTLARLRRIGFEPGKPFDLASLPRETREAVEKAPAEALSLLKAKLPTLARVANGWQMNTDTMGVYGNYYVKRAIVAMVGLGANQPEDAVYPLNLVAADGKPVVGTHRYVLHFSKDELPPADAFWSATMYDAEGFQVPNPINRFAIGDRDPLKYNADGSLDILIQHDSPGPEQESNWLPAPKGVCGITLRLYAPRPQALDGRWNPPAIRVVDGPMEVAPQ